MSMWEYFNEMVEVPRWGLWFSCFLTFTLTMTGSALARRWRNK